MTRMEELQLCARKLGIKDADMVEFLNLTARHQNLSTEIRITTKTLGREIEPQQVEELRQLADKMSQYIHHFEEWLLMGDAS